MNHIPALLFGGFLVVWGFVRIRNRDKVRLESPACADDRQLPNNKDVLAVFIVVCVLCMVAFFGLLALSH